ncbi:MAG: IS5 family transposase [Candidatus Undinarchaeales archaeon]|jgi:hypothetical protein|nr:IS5 family transposase [Candidatus Undinarchaeales archaeon]|tara:strand:- start:52 stop:981 length:930 start_codon:yes stop_codon:yes gene_type:complete
MTQTERWGPKRTYPRDWKAYDEELVRRGEFYLDLDWVRSWDAELATMNEGKNGAPFRFPESLIKLQGVWHQFVDLRGVEGITRKLTKFGLLPKFDDHTTVCRRLRRLDTTFNIPADGPIEVASDGTGLQLIDGGEYLRQKYGKKHRVWARVTIIADRKTKNLLGIDVTIFDPSSEPDAATVMIEELIEEGVDVDKFYGDGGFDKKELFEFLDEHGIEPIIKLPKNAVFGECEPRNRELKLYKKYGYKKWAKKKGYGMRWPGTEGIFSAVKRKFGEGIRERNEKSILNQARIKFWVYQWMCDYARAGAGA